MRSGLIAISMTVMGLSLAAGCTQTKRAEPAADGRQTLVLPPAERDAILAEMRQMLESTSGILHGSVANDMPAIEKAARASGVAMAVDSALEQHLPGPFLQWGMLTHQSFDQLADQAAAGGTRDDAIRTLAALSNNCVACHRTYRVETAR